MHRVEVTHKEGMLFDVLSKDYRFCMDVNGKGVTSPDALLASIGSCLGVYVRKYADGAKVPLDNFCITVEAELSKEAPVSFREIRVTLDLKGAALEERRKQALLEFMKNCPVHNTLKANPLVTLHVS